MSNAHIDFKFIKHVPLILKTEDLSEENEETTDLRLLEAVAEPTNGEELDKNCEHWADIVVTEAPEEEEETRVIKGEREEETGAIKSEEVNRDEATKEWYTCNLCNYRCEEVRWLTKHMSRKHTFFDKDCFICGFCKGKYADAEILDKHIVAHMPKKRKLELWKLDLMRFNPCVKGRTWSKRDREILERAFKKQQYPDETVIIQLAEELYVNKEKIREWFKNKIRSSKKKLMKKK